MRLSIRHTAMTWLALLALASQLLLSFSHTHANLAGGRGPALATGTLIKVLGLQQSQRQDPAAPALPSHDDNSCLVCWASSLVGSALLSAPAAVPGPVATLLGNPPDRATSWQLIRRLAQFRARAPPITTLV